MNRSDAIKKAATELGFWVDKDLRAYEVDAQGNPKPSIEIPSYTKLRKAQEYIIDLLTHSKTEAA